MYVCILTNLNFSCAVVEIAAEDGLEIDTYRDLTIARCIMDNKA